jgi:hypothetical protein
LLAPLNDPVLQDSIFTLQSTPMDDWPCQAQPSLTLAALVGARAAAKPGVLPARFTDAARPLDCAGMPPKRQEDAVRDSIAGAFSNDKAFSLDQSDNRRTWNYQLKGQLVVLVLSPK